MIPEINGAKAHFKYKDSEYTHDLPVVAWSDSGEPLVCREGGKSLVPADFIGGFVGVDWDERLLGVVPGSGWTVQHTQDDGSIWTEPVIAFAIDSDGWGKPICGSGDAEISPEKCDGNKVVLTPPNGWGA